MRQAELWRAFHERGCQRAREQLILLHLRYVTPTIRRVVPHLPGTIERDDLESEAMLAVVRAIDRFDPTRGVSSTTWVVGSIRHHLRQCLRAEDWAPRSVRAAEKRGEVVPLAVVSLEAVGQAEGHEDDDMSPLHDSLIDPAPSPFQAITGRWNQEAIRRLTRALSSREAQVLVDFYWHERDRREIAEKLGVSESRVYQIRQDALKRLRQLTRGDKAWDE